MSANDCSRAARLGVVADHRFLARGAGADQVAHYRQAGGDANPRGQRASRAGHRGEPADRFHQRQPGPHGMLGVGFACRRVSEIDQQPVAHVAGNEAAIADHLGGDGMMKRCDDFAQILRIEPRAECRGTDQVAEHHRELTAFRAWRRLRLFGRSRWGKAGRLQAAITAETGSGRVGAAAGRTAPWQGRAAIAAKTFAFRRCRSAAQAVHGCCPLPDQPPSSQVRHRPTVSWPAQAGHPRLVLPPAGWPWVAGLRRP